MSGFNRLVYFIARLLLLLGGLIAAMAAILLLIYFISGSGPAIRIGNQTFFDMTEWSKGIPARAHAIHSDLPDSILLNTGERKHLPVLNKEAHKAEVDEFLKAYQSPAPYTDTLNFSLHTINPYTIQVNALKIETLRAYVQPRDLIQKLYIFLPFILNLLLMAWAAWQLSRLLHHISKGNAFRGSNHRRIASIGYAILLVQAVFLVLHLQVNQQVIHMKVDGSWIKDKTLFSFFLESPFDLWWVLAGCLLLLLSKAWKDGVCMQEEQDSML